MLDLITTTQYGPMLALALIIMFIGFVAYQISFSTNILPSLASQPLAPPFVSLPAMAFFFMVGFISLHQLAKHEDSKHILAMEVSAVINLINIPYHDNPNQKKIRALLNKYLESSIEDEWLASQNHVGSQDVRKIIQDMSGIIYSPGFSCPSNVQSNKNCVSQFTANAYADNLSNLSMAHNKRILLGQLDSTLFIWYISLGLAFIASLTTAAIHRNNKTSVVISLILFLISAWLTLSIIALHQSPYRGPNSILPIPLIEIQRNLQNTFEK
jgi:hypothetical protein